MRLAFALWLLLAPALAGAESIPLDASPGPDAADEMEEDDGGGCAIGGDPSRLSPIVALVGLAFLLPRRRR